MKYEALESDLVIIEIFLKICLKLMTNEINHNNFTLFLKKLDFAKVLNYFKLFLRFPFVYKFLENFIVYGLY